MENTISIKNENLSNYVMFKLDKLNNEFTEQELNEITEIVIDYNNESESCFVFLEELLKLKKLKAITIRNGYIYNDNYNIFSKLANLTEIVFQNCEFEDTDMITTLNLQSLSLINCKIYSYSFVNILEELTELTIINGNIELEKINMLNKLKYLQISYSNIIANANLNIERLEELYIDNTNINNFEFLNYLPNLKRISIDEKQFDSNRQLFINLMEKNILIMNENMVEFGGEND